MGGDLEHDPLICIPRPMCQRCKRVEAPALMPSSIGKALENLLKHLKANVCCKKCGHVMDLEVRA